MGRRLTPGLLLLAAAFASAALIAVRCFIGVLVVRAPARRRAQEPARWP